MSRKLIGLFACLILPPDLSRSAALFPWTLPWNDAADNALSMVRLNDHVAGSRGFVVVSPDGHLQAGGQRLRFWGANLVAAGAFPAYTDADAMAGRLAKFGVNIARFHHMDATWGSRSIWQDSGLDRGLDPVSLDRLDYLVSRLAGQGIYTNLNLVVGRPFNAGAELDPSISLITDWKHRAVLGFFDPAQLQLQRDFARDLLTHVNPYTGLSYAQDPAVAFVEINNENGLVQAWMSRQLDGLPAYYDGLLNAQWNQWLVLKYGTQPLLESAWGVSITALGPEKIGNGGFSGLAGWTLQALGSPAAVAAATVQPDGAGGTSVARVVISSPGQEGWHVQLWQAGLSVTAGAVYTLGFWAKADAPRGMNVSLMRNYGDFGSAGLSADISLDSAWSYHEFAFAPASGDGNLRINFGNLGLATGTVWVGSVSLRGGGSLGLYPGEALGGTGIRNFRYGGEPVARTVEGRRDWLRFLLRTEELYWLSMRDYLRDDLGVRALIMGTIQGCSTPNLQAAFDGIDSHYYWKHPAFPGAAWDPVDWYVQNDAMPDDPSGSGPASIGLQAVLGKPHSVTELNAPYPSTFEADIFMVTAAYAGLQDLDAVYPFAHWGDEGGFSGANLQDYFTLGYNPLKMAAMPAAAAAFRRGDFAPSASLVAVPMNRAQELEQLLDAGAWSLVNAATAGEDRRAPLIRRVRQLVEGQSAPPGALAPGASGPYGADLAAEGGQLRWITGGVGGLVTGDSPRSQFAAGFLAGRSPAFSAMTVSAVDSLQAGDYALVALSSRDGLPLTATAGALLTVLGLQRNSGSTYFQYPATPTGFPPAKGLPITLRDQRGAGPVQVEGVSATVTLAFSPAEIQVFALLPDGSRGAALPVADAGGRAQIEVGPAYATLLYEVAVDRPGYSPTPTRSPSPGLSPTPTRSITLTPTATPVPASVLWEDMETGAVPAASQAFADTATGGILGVQRVSGTAAAAGAYAHAIRFNSGGPAGWGGGFMVNSSYGTKPALGWRNLEGMQVLRLRLWTDRPGLRVRPTLVEAGNTATAVGGADGETWESANGAWTVLPAGTWVDLSFPLALFRDKPNWPYSPTSLGNNNLDLAALAWIQVEWEGNQGADITLRVDDVAFERDLPTATPTASPTHSTSPTPSVTATLGANPPTASPTASPTLAPRDPGGRLRVREQRVMPQPVRNGSGRLFFDLEGGAEEVDWKVYSTAAVLLHRQRLAGPFGAGWSSRPVALAGLPSGLHYSVLQARRGAESSEPSPKAFYILW